MRLHKLEGVCFLLCTATFADISCKEIGVMCMQPKQEVTEQRTPLAQKDIDTRVSLVRCICNAALFSPNVHVYQTSRWKTATWHYGVTRAMCIVVIVLMMVTSITTDTSTATSRTSPMLATATQYTPRPQLPKQLDYQQIQYYPQQISKSQNNLPRTTQ